MEQEEFLKTVVKMLNLIRDEVVEIHQWMYHLEELMKNE
jgi:hypothetical protein